MLLWYKCSFVLLFKHVIVNVLKFKAQQLHNISVYVLLYIMSPILCDLSRTHLIITYMCIVFTQRLVFLNGTYTDINACFHSLQSYTLVRVVAL